MTRLRRAVLLASAAFALLAAPVQAQQSLDQRVQAAVRYEADEMEERIVRSGMRNTDPALNAYVQRIGCAIAGERCGELRFYILETPEFNASMAPNGMMMINSGLLLRVESEAELAFVMAHEFNHYADNDTVEIMARMRSANARGLVVMMGLAMVGAGGLSQLGYLGAMSNVFSFSRDQERESDTFASQFADTHDYDSHAGVRAWEHLRDEMQASSNEDTRRRYTRGSMFSTHPLTEERIAYLSAAPRAHPGAGEDHAAYRATVQPQLRRWLDAEISARDPGATLHLLDRLAAPGTNPGVISYARGEVYRYRSDDGDAALALAAYAQAVQYEDAPVEAWRQIGVMRRRGGDAVGADEAFRRYLALLPNAPDRQLVSAMITTPEPEPAPASVLTPVADAPAPDAATPEAIMPTTAISLAPAASEQIHEGEVQ